MTIIHIELKQINEVQKTLQNMKQPKCTKMTVPSAIFSWAANSLVKSENINQGPDIIRKQITCRIVQRWRNDIGYRRQALRPWQSRNNLQLVHRGHFCHRQVHRAVKNSISLSTNSSGQSMLLCWAACQNIHVVTRGDIKELYRHSSSFGTGWLCFPGHVTKRYSKV